MDEDDAGTARALIQEQYRNAGKQVGRGRRRRPTKPCQFEGCEGWAWARGFCGSHYQQMKRDGKLPTVRIMGDPVARFRVSYEVNPDTGCWEWTGWIHPKGYGVLPMGGKSKKVRAHRFSWEVHFGPIPDGMDVLHRCDNRKCCYPDHLFLGDDAANAQDCVAKGRHNSQIGTYQRKLTRRMIATIRVLYARGRHSCSDLAALYGVDEETVRRIVKGVAHLAA